MSKADHSACEEHPLYNGVETPTEGCLVCWQTWVLGQLDAMPEFNRIEDFVVWLKGLGFEEIQIISDTPLDLQ